MGGVFKFNLKKKIFYKIVFILKYVYLFNKLDFLNFLNKELFKLNEIFDNLDFILLNLIDIANILELLFIIDNIKIFSEILCEINLIESNINILELQLLFYKNKYFNYNCYIDIQSGSGGIESQDWAFILFKMYVRWLEMHNFNFKIIEESAGETLGIKSITIKIVGDYAYGLLNAETGIHRLVRKSPFNSFSKRHTSFCSVFVYPKIINNIDIKINSHDLRIDIYRSSGSGGQHVNKTESAVRITHLPTNIVTQCQSDRSQHVNKNKAIKKLKLKLYKFELKKINIKKFNLESTKLNISWGNQIRSYIFDNSFIKDLRTGLEIRNVQYVLNGNLDKFIKASLKLFL